MKTFDNEWIFEAFDGRPTFFTKRMFGGLAAYLHERQMLVLVEPTKTGRWKWHGVLVCTGHEHQASIRADFPALRPHDVLRKWARMDAPQFRAHDGGCREAHVIERPALRHRAGSPQSATEVAQGLPPWWRVREAKGPELHPEDVV